ncbi:MAG TPA: hypothetical protein ENJ09_09785 [Planctomycetes bacterium]|nr:hypothetical protein [Planctomycetota bacterium]
MLPSCLVLLPTLGLLGSHPSPLRPLADERTPGAIETADSSEPQGPDRIWVHADRLIVRPGEELENASLLIEDGVIVRVGPDVEAPEGARRIEGRVVCAGFVDGWSTLGIEPAGVRDQSALAATRSLDGFDPFRSPEDREIALRAGVTSERIQVGAIAAIGGIGSVVRTELGDRPEVVADEACVAATVGITRGGRAVGVFDRVSEVDRLVAQLQKGASYRKSELKYRDSLEEWQEAIAKKREELEDDFKKAKKKRDKDVAEAEEKGKEYKEKRYKEDKKPKKPRWDPNVEVLARVTDGEIPLAVEAHRVPELRGLLEKTTGFDRLRLVVLGGSEAGFLADELAERHIPVMLWPTPDRSGRPEMARASLELAGELAEAGVEVLIGSGGSANAGSLRLLAAAAVGHGLDRDAALSAITLGPARAFDVADRIGSLEPGKDADLLVLDGDPLDTTAPIRFVLSHGRVVVEP